MSRGNTAVLENKLKTNTHNYGIDLLRCVSMLMIVVIHIYNRGGVMSSVQTAGAGYLNYGVRLICLGAVNLFAMISGYVMLNGQFRLYKLVSLWLQVFFIGVLLCAAGALFYPQSIQTKSWIRALMPVTQKEFWYFSAYIGVFVMSPVVNRGILALSKKQAFFLMTGCILLFSVGGTLGYYYQGDPFAIKNGYSVLWLLVLYMIGACIKHTGLLERIRPIELLCVMVFCFAISMVWYSVSKVGLLYEKRAMVSDYLNPFMLVFDICLFGLFSKMKFRKALSVKVIRFLAPLTFSVYIIHVHSLFWTFLNNRFVFLAQLPTLLIAPAVFGFALAIYLFCSLLDELRLLLFKVLHVRKFSIWLETRIKKILTTLYGCFDSKDKKIGS